MLKWAVVRKLLIVALSVALVAAIVVPGYKMRKQREIQQTCRLRLEQVMKAQEKYFAQHGEYASEPTELFGDSLDFTCPQDGSPFVLEVPDSINYKLSCPNGHGWVSSERASWKQEE